MTIAALKKLTLVGPIEVKTEALEGLQALGCLHLIPLAPPPDAPEEAAPRGAEEALKALRFLTGAGARRRQLRPDPAFDVDALIRDALALKQKLRDVGDRRDFLERRIAEVRPWGDVAFPPEAALEGQHLWFYRLPVRERSALAHPDLPPWSIVTIEDGLLYVVVIAPEEPPAELLPVPRTHIGALPLAELERQLDDAEIELEHLRAERVAMSRYTERLRGALAAAFTRAELAYAARQTRDDDAVFALQGWVPEARVGEVLALADQMTLAAVVERPGWTETPPTLLDRHPDEAAGVDLALFYQAPHYRSWDPSAILVASFALFFAMIVADAGYGALILLGLLASWRRLSGSARARSWRRVGLITALATVVYGVLIGGYFGVGPPEGSLLGQLQVLRLDDFDTMMRLSIGIGAGHLILANLLSALAKRGRGSAIADLGWAAGVLGGLALWLGGDGALALAGGVLLALGLALVLLFTSERPVQSPIDWAWRLLDGAQRLGSVMGAFGDVLSYLRLFALGLASSSLALTFNQLAAGVVEALPGLGVLVAALILLAGHALNFALALLSGVVHGLRLNYIEFYKWGLPEEGVAFRPFARQEAPE